MGQVITGSQSSTELVGHHSWDQQLGQVYPEGNAKLSHQLHSSLVYWESRGWNSSSGLFHTGLRGPSIYPQYRHIDYSGKGSDWLVNLIKPQLLQSGGLGSLQGVLISP